MNMAPLRVAPFTNKLSRQLNSLYPQENINPNALNAHINANAFRICVSAKQSDVK